MYFLCKSQMESLTSKIILFSLMIVVVLDHVIVVRSLADDGGTASNISCYPQNCTLASSSTPENGNKTPDMIPDSETGSNETDGPPEVNGAPDPTLINPTGSNDPPEVNEVSDPTPINNTGSNDTDGPPGSNQTDPSLNSSPPVNGSNLQEYASDSVWSNETTVPRNYEPPSEPPLSPDEVLNFILDFGTMTFPSLLGYGSDCEPELEKELFKELSSLVQGGGTDAPRTKDNKTSVLTATLRDELLEKAKQTCDSRESMFCSNVRRICLCEGDGFWDLHDYENQFQQKGQGQGNNETSGSNPLLKGSCRIPYGFPCSSSKGESKDHESFPETDPRDFHHHPLCVYGSECDPRSRKCVCSPGLSPEACDALKYGYETHLEGTLQQISSLPGWRDLNQSCDLNSTLTRFNRLHEGLSNLEMRLASWTLGSVPPGSCLFTKNLECFKAEAPDDGSSGGQGAEQGICACGPNSMWEWDDLSDQWTCAATEGSLCEQFYWVEEALVHIDLPCAQTSEPDLRCVSRFHVELDVSYNVCCNVGEDYSQFPESLCFDRGSSGAKGTSMTNFERMVQLASLAVIIWLYICN